ncbi:MAG TPA: arginine deiminase family protein [Roseiflexaceae bacterium]|nr:arginine deiminase family protein [Roseiflexaceae bacterium]HMP42379.1 arginine deiminase family protein [Roseiflexaceae bacterium]
MAAIGKQIHSAYGGPGWRPRERTTSAEIGALWAACGIDSEWQRLRSVLLHRPGPELAASVDSAAVNMLAPLDIARAQAQHDALAAAYRTAGVQVHYADPAGEPTPNQMFMADLFFMTPEGAILARPASEVRAGEERIAARRLADIGIPIVRSISGRATFEGADAMWLDAHTVLVGRGLRTNDAGAAQIAAVLREMNVETIIVDMPFGTMHLMGMLRIVDHNLAIAWPTRLVHRAVDALRERGYQVAFLPDDQPGVTGTSFNFVTLGRREIVMAAGHTAAQAFYEALDITCRTVEVDELAKAAGAIGCLSGIVARDRM